MDNYNYNDNAKTPAELADEAAKLGSEASDTVQGYAQAAKQTTRAAAESIAPHVEEAKRLGNRAAADAKAYVGQAKETVKAAMDTGRVYAKDAVNAAGKKIDDLKGQIDQAKQAGAQYVIDEPVRAVVMAAVGGALITALFLAAMRGGRR